MKLLKKTIKSYFLTIYVCHLFQLEKTAEFLYWIIKLFELINLIFEVGMY